MKQIEIPAGMKDTILQECEKKRILQNKIESIFESYGYQEIITPTIEFYKTYENSFESLNSSDLYKFFDENGDILALRMDMTVPIARVCASKFKDMKPPFRFRYTSNVFKVRQKFAGKRSEVSDCGVELIGLDEKSDAQVLVLALDVMKDFKEYTLEIGNVKFFQAACNVLRLNEYEKNVLAKLIDQKSMVDLKEYLSSLYLSENIIDFFMELPFLCGSVDVLDKAYQYCFDDSLKKVLDSMKSCISILQDIGYADHITVDLGKVPHLDYYTGIIFEGYVAGVGISVLSGGRYDQLLSKFGRDLPAIGFSVKLDPLVGQIELEEKKVISIYYPSNKLAMALLKAEQLRYDHQVRLIESNVSEIEMKEERL